METRPNGVSISRTYDADNHLLSVVSRTSANTTLASFSYVYDVDGRRTSVAEADGSLVSYSYDGAGRLVAESRTGSNSYSISYTLDGEGNRLSGTVNGFTTTFVYDAAGAVAT
ncbi:RHS repeat protein [Chthonomonas calidirosea]|uniref:RHS repeat domain-containing protein n=1 Tax=Chthonomonas calidirosea TaxID=454171 RepID=UPI0006DD4F5D|nr:RHS repeat domain-containing protein [Chthonomonas calidirosea]CEK17106.1 RHS repeat protein [Chthonomonas calidirosea]CEK17121.1 RHS repeat protein [Chthonomonas calidirosea]